MLHNTLMDLIYGEVTSFSKFAKVSFCNLFPLYLGLLNSNHGKG